MYILSNITSTVGYHGIFMSWTWRGVASSARRSLIRMGRWKSTWFVVHQRKVPEGGSFEHGSHVPVVCWKDFLKKLFDKQAWRKLIWGGQLWKKHQQLTSGAGSNFGTFRRCGSILDSCILWGHMQVWCFVLNDSTAWVANLWMEKLLEKVRFSAVITLFKANSSPWK